MPKLHVKIEDVSVSDTHVTMETDVRAVPDWIYNVYHSQKFIITDKYCIVSGKTKLSDSFNVGDYIFLRRNQRNLSGYYKITHKEYIDITNPPQQLVLLKLNNKLLSIKLPEETSGGYYLQNGHVTYHPAVTRFQFTSDASQNYGELKDVEMDFWKQDVLYRKPLIFVDDEGHIDHRCPLEHVQKIIKNGDNLLLIFGLFILFGYLYITKKK